MSKLKKIILIISVTLLLSVLITLEYKGDYFSSFAILIEKKFAEKPADSLHHLDLQKYRPNLPNP